MCASAGRAWPRDWRPPRVLLPSACVYLQSETETLQLDVALVLEPWLLTALGARPGSAPFPSRQQAACRWRDPESQAEQGASGISDAGEGPCGHHGHSPNVLPDLTEQLELGRDMCVTGSDPGAGRRPWWDL